MQMVASMPVVSDVEIDRAVIRAFGAFTTCLGPHLCEVPEGQYLTEWVLSPARWEYSSWLVQQPEYLPAIRTSARATCPLLVCSSSLVDSRDFANAYLPAHFFDRYIFSVEKTQERQAQLEKEAELRFLTTVQEGVLANERIANRSFDSTLNTILCEASRICGRVLGEWDIDEIWDRCKHGPGASTTVKLRDAFLDVKSVDISGTAQTLETFIVDYLAWDTSLKSWLRKGWEHNPQNLTVREVKALNMSFVPNKYDKLRAITPETTLGMFFQQGTGSLVAERLVSNANIDIATQADCHRKLVRIASLHSGVKRATIDWSEASDRVWTELCRALFPSDWFEWLLMIRCGDVLVGGQLVNLPMISTMGNGFTFPIETLVFYSLLCALARRHGFLEEEVSVFGDDCIIPEGLEPYVRELADLVGWKLNKDKSFWSGGFRESCGADAYRGLRMRPFKVQRPDCTGATKGDSSLKAWAYIVFNGMLESVLSAGVGEDSESLAPLWEWLVEIHEAWDLGEVLLVPPRFSDTSGARIELSKYDPYFSQMWDWSYYNRSDVCSHFPAGVKIPKFCRGDKRDPSLMWRFDSLAPVVSRRKPVWGEYPYMLRRIRGKQQEAGIDYRGTKRYDACELPPSGLDGRGEEPRKGLLGYSEVRRCVHNWSYFLD